MANQVVKKPGGRISKADRTKLLANIRGLFESKTIGDYSERDLVLKFGYARETIRSYLEEVRLEVDPKDIQSTKLKFKSLFEDAIQTCEDLVKSAVSEHRERDARESIKLLIDVIKQQTDFMERFFIKEKVADRLDMNVREERVNININVPVIK